MEPGRAGEWGVKSHMRMDGIDSGDLGPYFRAPRSVVREYAAIWQDLGDDYPDSEPDEEDEPDNSHRSVPLCYVHNLSISQRRLPERYCRCVPRVYDYYDECAYQLIESAHRRLGIQFTYPPRPQNQ